jgi:heme-degrading monooxygenase HmoA
VKKYIALLAGGLVLLLSGCGSQADQSTVSIDDKGRVTAEIVESFDKSYYDFEELEETVNQAVDEYNGQQEEERIQVKTCKEDRKKGEVRVTLRYDSCEDYQNFNQRELYRGTVAQAAEKYDFGGVFLDRQGEETDGKTIQAEYSEAEVIVLQEPVRVATPENILYVSDNVQILGDKAAKIPDDGNQDNENADTSIYEYAYIIYLNEK